MVGADVDNGQWAILGAREGPNPTMLTTGIISRKRF